MGLFAEEIAGQKGSELELLQENDYEDVRWNTLRVRSYFCDVFEECLKLVVVVVMGGIKKPVIILVYSLYSNKEHIPIQKLQMFFNVLNFRCVRKLIGHPV